MDAIQVIGLILIITALFALGGKIVLYLKKRELEQTIARYEQQIVELKKKSNSIAPRLPRAATKCCA